jgi:guanylate kinase
MSAARKKRAGSVIVISAPSGSGKSTLVKKLMASVSELVFSVSYTTRAKRPGEKHGREYFFIAPAVFKRMAAAGEFVEWADVHGQLYGTARAQIRKVQAAGKDVLLDIDVQGHQQVRRKMPDAVSIFLLPPSYGELERRLRQRHSDAPESIRKRLRNAHQEIRRWKEYDYLIVNDHVASALHKLRAVVEGARARREVQQTSVHKILKTFGGKTK